MSLPELLPLSAMPVDFVRNCVGLASDFDDTITAHHTLTEASLSAMVALERAGLPCVIVTGRPLGWAEVLTRVLPVRAVVAENGGCWVVREAKGHRVEYLQSERERRDGMAQAQAVAAALQARYPALGPVRDLGVRATDHALDLHEYANIPEDHVQDCLARVRASGLHAVASTVHLHISARAPDKAEGLRAAAQDLGFSADDVKSRWTFIGDSPNDESGFAGLEHSVGVATVRRYAGKLNHWPKYVTTGGAGEGFSELAAHLLKGRER